MEQETTFYEKVQKAKGLDLRDNRGKRHDLAFVLVGIIIGLLRKRDGNLSSIHRSMVNKHKELCDHLGVKISKAVSRAQLPRILSKVDLIVFEELLFATYGIELEASEKQWFASDGKDLRGSIEKGSTRGEALVQLVRHKDKAVLGQSRYNGKKESEKPCVVELIKKEGAENQKITADALHLHPKMTELIEQKGGTFLIGLKGNQKELLEDMVWHVKNHEGLTPYQTLDKGHGRLEQRQYCYFDIRTESFDKRWNKTGFKTLFRVIRQRTILKNDITSQEVAYFLSNADLAKPCENPEEYYNAIRNHWSVEVNNHIRDVSLKEDDFRTKKSLLQK